jgi:hypothetical protein
MSAIATTHFMWTALIWFGVSFVFTCLGYGVAAVVKKGWALIFPLAGKVAMFVTWLAFCLLALLNIAVYLIQVAKS